MFEHVDESHDGAKLARVLELQGCHSPALSLEGEDECDGNDAHDGLSEADGTLCLSLTCVTADKQTLVASCDAWSAHEKVESVTEERGLASLLNKETQTALAQGSALSTAQLQHVLQVVLWSYAELCMQARGGGVYFVRTDADA